MSYLITAIAFIVIFSFLVLVHEWGHFTMAKRVGIKVEEFGFGLPPRLWGKKKGETIYSVNWIPFGGFVRMLGEDSHDPKAMKNKRSFCAQSPWSRIKVVCAGVFMNFLVAYLLLVIGFSVGMQPLLGPNDVLGAVSEGQIVLDSGVKVDSVHEGSVAADWGLMEGDALLEFRGEAIDSNVLLAIGDDPVGEYKFLREGAVLTFNASEQELSGQENVGVAFMDFAPFPRVKVFALGEGTDSYKAGLRPGDVLVNVNGKQIFTVEEFEDSIRGEPVLLLQVYRDGVTQELIVERADARQVIISRVLPGSPAMAAGFESADLLLSVNGKEIRDSQEMISFIGENTEEALAFLVMRDGREMFIEVQPEEGKIGVLLSELMNYGAEQGMSLYNVDMLTSVVEIKDEQYPLHIALYKGFSETYRMSLMTGDMFIGFVRSLLSTGEVPESVAGPVGIAQMTHVFVQEGLIPLLRFVAILSLSLAVINILPFPALDGGRLLFILVEVFTGKKMNQKLEAYVHFLGYVLILGLILAVTYSDILRLIQ
jgi:regulator of sigma E protease